MNIVIVGHVDHGKSTVVGRLLADTGSLPKGKLEQVKEFCKRHSRPFEYAFLLDALKDEQSQGITIDSARCFFKSRKRGYIIIDAPGHIEFLKNMISGAARAEAALLVIDAEEGIKENSRRHGYMLSMLGIRQVAVLVNKMDLIGYSQEIFDKVKSEYGSFLKQIGIVPETFIPVSAREGDNIIRHSDKMDWFTGHNVLSVLDNFKKAKPLEESSFRMPVQDVYKFTKYKDSRRIIAGRIESGSISAGDKVIFLPSGKHAEIKSIESFNASPKKKISAPYCAGFTLTEQIYVDRGQVMCKVNEKPPLVGQTIMAHIFWMGKAPMQLDKEYKLKLATSSVQIRLQRITKVLDASSLEQSSKSYIERNDVAECMIYCKKEIAFDLAAEIEPMGRFVIVDSYDIAGGGIIIQSVEDKEMKAIKEDLRGKVCPFTLDYSKPIIENIRKGQIIEILVDHLPAVESIGRFCFEHNLKFDFEKEEGHIKLTIRA